MNKHLIFIVEDDAHIAQLVKYNLEQAGYQAQVFEDGNEAAEAVFHDKPDLILLDIMLPGKDGIEILKLLRRNEETKQILVIMLTAKNEEFDRVLGLELGADDYISKPFSSRELVARVKAVLRRRKESGGTVAEGNEICFGNLRMDVERHRVFLGNKELELTYKEFELLKYLIKNRGRVLKRDFLLDEIWGYDTAVETRTVDVHIRRLRMLIGEDYIETVRGIGYRFSDQAK